MDAQDDKWHGFRISRFTLSSGIIEVKFSPRKSERDRFVPPPLYVEVPADTALAKVGRGPLSAGISREEFIRKAVEFTRLTKADADAAGL